MAQYDIYRPVGKSILLVDCQNDYLRQLKTRFVLPLIPVAQNPPQATRLNPLLSVNGADYILAPNAAATMPVAELGMRIASVANDPDIVKLALAQLITGF